MILKVFMNIHKQSCLLCDEQRFWTSIFILKFSYGKIFNISHLFIANACNLFKDLEVYEKYYIQYQEIQFIRFYYTIIVK